MWPTLLPDSDGCAAGLVDIERVWPTRSSISSETWHALFSKATEALDILVYAGAFLIEALDLADVLAWKAAQRNPDPRPGRRSAQRSSGPASRRAVPRVAAPEMPEHTGLPPSSRRHQPPPSRRQPLRKPVPLRRPAPGEHPRLRHLGLPLTGPPAAQVKLGHALRLLHHLLRPHLAQLRTRTSRHRHCHARDLNSSTSKQAQTEDSSDHPSDSGLSDVPTYDAANEGSAFDPPADSASLERASAAWQMRRS